MLDIATFPVVYNVVSTNHLGKHYRRYINIEDLKSRIENLGMKVIVAEESNTFAVLGLDTPVCIRVVATTRHPPSDTSLSEPPLSEPPNTPPEEP